MSKPVIIEPADFVIPKPPTIFEYALGSFTNEGIIDPPAGYPGVQSYAADAAFANDGGGLWRCTYKRGRLHHHQQRHDQGRRLSQRGQLHQCCLRHD